MKTPFLIVLTGLPAAGKSTFALKMANLLDQEEGPKTMVIASDTVRSEIPALAEEFLPELEPSVRALCLDRVASALRSGLNVIHDDLNYYRSMRFELVSIARDVGCPCGLIHLATPASECLNLNAARGRKIPDEVIRKDSARFDPPGTDPWDIPIAAVNALEMNPPRMKEIQKLILTHMADYTPWIPMEEQVHEPSRSEALDLISRKVVSELFRSSKGKADGRAVSKLRLILSARAQDEGLSDEEAENLFHQALSPLFGQ